MGNILRDCMNYIRKSDAALFLRQMCDPKNYKCISFRMDVCVESALLSSLIGWSSANPMAVMGERCLYDGISLACFFSLGAELESGLLVEMSRTKCSEQALAH